MSTDKHDMYKLKKVKSQYSSCPSIPSKYQIISRPAREKKGFNSCSVRLGHLNINDEDIPGPNHYNVPCNIMIPTQSYSKQGTCGFPSKAKRFSSLQRRNQVLPGPGSYNPLLKAAKEDFCRAKYTRAFQHPLVTQHDHTTATFQPGPNSYNVTMGPVTRNNYITGAAAFKSKTPRHSEYISDTPGPAHYNPTDHYTCSYHSPNKQTANFCSKTKRSLTPNKHNPGPADYFKNESRKKSSKLYRHHQHYLCISAPAIPLPPCPPLPGPGHYEISSNIQDIQLVSGSVFKSTSSRWNATGKSPDVAVGPGSYNLTNNEKQSFLYNWSQRWI